MDSRTRLNVIYSDGGVETNFSSDAHDFKRDTFSATLTTDDFMYVGYHKPINALYIAMTTPNTITSSMSFEYYSDSGWVALEVSDDTKALIRDGFVNWTRVTDAAEISIAGISACWIRFAANDDIDPVTFQAINLLFSDDNDMCSEVPALVDPCFYPSGQTSHLLQHSATKNYIMSRLRSLGYIKQTASGEENINEWDVLDVFELKQAAMYHAIAQIYFNLSDDVDDQYWNKYKEYFDKFEEAFSLGQLRIDGNDNGQVDLSEKRPVKTIRWGR